jgi:hypothetical protein
MPPEANARSAMRPHRTINAFTRRGVLVECTADFGEIDKINQTEHDEFPLFPAG